jgi:hypothetical protein
MGDEARCGGGNGRRPVMGGVGAEVSGARGSLTGPAVAGTAGGR